MRGRRHYTLVFDGSCGLCAQIVAWLSRRRPRVAIRYVDYHDAAAMQDLPVSFDEADRSVILLTPSGAKLKGYGATVGVIRLLPWVRRAAPLLRLVWPAGAVGYAFVTRYRHRISRVLGLEPRRRVAKRDFAFYHSSG
jgi:predicted DCC family thiol-disulfide oxidoreductase YuxK